MRLGDEGFPLAGSRFVIRQGTSSNTLNLIEATSLQKPSAPLHIPLCVIYYLPSRF